MLNRQLVFTTALTAIIAQGEFAIDPERGICMYRTKNGSKCAVGHLIDDAKYDSNIEDTAVSTWYYDRFSMLDKKFGKPQGGDKLFLAHLQKCLHDEPERIWTTKHTGHEHTQDLFEKLVMEGARSLAEQYELEMPC